MSEEQKQALEKIKKLSEISRDNKKKRAWANVEIMGLCKRFGFNHNVWCY